MPRQTPPSQYSKTDISVPVFQDQYLSPNIPRPISQSQHSKIDISVLVFQDGQLFQDGIPGQTSQSHYSKTQKYFKTSISVPVFQDTDFSVTIFQDRHLQSQYPGIPRQTSRSQYSKTNISVPVVQDRHRSSSIPISQSQ